MRLRKLINIIYPYYAYRDELNKPSLMKLGKSSGALFSLCLRLFCSNKRLSSYGLLLFVFAYEDKVGNKPDVNETTRISLRLNFSSQCNTCPFSALICKTKFLVNNWDSAILHFHLLNFPNQFMIVTSDPSSCELCSYTLHGCS